MDEQEARPKGTTDNGWLVNASHQSQCCPKLRELFGIDLRSLAVFRIAAAVLILIDLLLRFPFIEANYTDVGVLPRALAPDHPIFFLHSLSGVYSFQCLCFVLTAVFTVMLLVGYRTTLATVAVWFLLACLHVRNPFLLDGQDHLPRQLLFWSMFLPLGARFSIDAARNPRLRQGETTVLSAASVAILCQFVFLYVTTGIVKTSPDWQTGAALEVVLSDQNWTLPFGRFLLQFPQILKVLTWAVVYFEIFGPFLMFLPVCTGPVRVLTIGAFLILQVGIGLSIELHLFPWTSSLATLPFIPVWFWNKLKSRVRIAVKNTTSAPTGSITNNLEPGNQRWWIGAREGLVCLFLLLAILLNLYWVGDGRDVQSLQSLQPLTKIARFLGMNQRWIMYAGAVTHETTHVLVGVQQDGTEVEFLKVSGDKRWEKARHLHKSYRFRIAQGPILRFVGTRQVYLDWLCRQWNAEKTGDQNLAFIRVFHDLRDIRPGTPGRRVRKLVVEHRYSLES